MTTNQKIDGVPRELLEASWAALMQKGQVIKALHLRDLLDAPAPVPTPAAWMRFDQDQKAVFTRGKRTNDSEPLYPHPTAYRVPAAQPQGEQVACMPVERCYDVRVKMIIAFNEVKKAGGDLDEALDAAYKSALRYSPNPANAEQPAPVAVVLPARPRADEEEYERMTDYEKGLLHGGIELWDKIDEVTRLNVK
ncbi:hypothetical protein [Pseudomonas sp. BTN1]|uniref:hypothetical protein n=1 Tax=Pseudomonas sp. BTN1 TaxID=1750647 RepID=UPI00093BB6A3|nr:hypothetical protein [Pseudomonas sp. BTN1]OKO47351.1 hypothetical protein BMH52_15600 [Pseudomonas sp. BTN1]